MVKSAGISEEEGDLFRASRSTSLAHCVSSDMKMGAGIAVHFRKRFGCVEDLIHQKKSVGEVAYLKDGPRFIFYLVTKKWFYEKPTELTLQNSLLEMKAKCRELGVTNLAMPRIGCGLDGLKWPVVFQMIKEIFSDCGMEVTIYSIPDKNNCYLNQKLSRSRQISLKISDNKRPLCLPLSSVALKRKEEFESETPNIRRRTISNLYQKDLVLDNNLDMMMRFDHSRNLSDIMKSTSAECDPEKHNPLYAFESGNNLPWKGRSCPSASQRENSSHQSSSLSVYHKVRNNCGIPFLSYHEREGSNMEPKFEKSYPLCAKTLKHTKVNVETAYLNNSLKVTKTSPDATVCSDGDKFPLHGISRLHSRYSDKKSTSSNCQQTQQEIMYDSASNDDDPIRKRKHKSSRKYDKRSPTPGKRASSLSDSKRRKEKESHQHSRKKVRKSTEVSNSVERNSQEPNRRKERKSRHSSTSTENKSRKKTSCKLEKTQDHGCSGNEDNMPKDERQGKEKKNQDAGVIRRGKSKNNERESEDLYESSSSWTIKSNFNNSVLTVQIDSDDSDNEIVKPIHHMRTLTNKLIDRLGSFESKKSSPSYEIRSVHNSPDLGYSSLKRQKEEKKTFLPSSNNVL